MTKYEILGVSSNANQEEIKKAYRNLVKRYHPDNNPNDLEAERKYKEVCDAYETLEYPEKRKQYDLTINTRVNKNEFNGRTNYDDTTSIFSYLFGTDSTRADYIKFLEENEKRANWCGRTLKPLIKEAEEIIFDFMLYEKKIEISRGLKELEEKCRAYDRYIEFLNRNQSRASLCNWSFAKEKERIQGKRGVFTKRKIQNFMQQVEKYLVNYEQERITKMEILKTELKKKNLDFIAYLAERNLLENTVTTNQLSTMIDSFKLMDEINLQLTPVGITLDEILQVYGKGLLEIRNHELIRLRDSIQILIKEDRLGNINDIVFANFNDEESITKHA